MLHYGREGGSYLQRNHLHRPGCRTGTTPRRQTSSGSPMSRPFGYRAVTGLYRALKKAMETGSRGSYSSDVSLGAADNVRPACAVGRAELFDGASAPVGFRRFTTPFAPDQSGAVSVLYDMGGICVICDAGGCTGNICGFDEPRWFGSQSAVFSAGLRDMDAILGRDDKLVEKLADAARMIPASFAAIVGTPVPAVIGTDYRALCRMAEERKKQAFLSSASTQTAWNIMTGDWKKLIWLLSRTFCRRQDGQESAAGDGASSAAGTSAASGASEAAGVSSAAGTSTPAGTSTAAGASAAICPRDRYLGLFSPRFCRDPFRGRTAQADQADGIRGDHLLRCRKQSRGSAQACGCREESCSVARGDGRSPDGCKKNSELPGNTGSPMQTAFLTDSPPQCRPERPWSFTSRYWRMPSAQAFAEKACRRTAPDFS